MGRERRGRSENRGDSHRHEASLWPWAGGRRGGEVQGWGGSISPSRDPRVPPLGQGWLGQALKDSREQRVLGPWQPLTQAWGGFGERGPSQIVGSLDVDLQAVGPGEGGALGRGRDSPPGKRRAGWDDGAQAPQRVPRVPEIVRSTPDPG